MARSLAYRIGEVVGLWLLIAYVVLSLVAVPVAIIAWIWGMDARIMATVLVNACVAMIVASAAAS